MSAAIPRDPRHGLLGRLLRTHAPVTEWQRDAAREVSTRKFLEKLGKDRWSVLHNVPLGPNHKIDHLIIGTAGVFAVTTKELSGRVHVSGRALWGNGERNEFISIALNESREAMTKLSEAMHERVYVRPLLVLLVNNLVIETEPGDVTVLRRRDLLRWLERQKPVMPITRAVTIGKVAMLDETWES